MVLRINEDRVVGTSSHAGFAANANRFVEIDNAISALEHRRGRAGSYTRRVRALITAGNLVRAACLWKDPYVDVLDVSARDPDWHDVFRLTGSRAGVTANAPGVVDDLGPLNW